MRMRQRLLLVLVLLAPPLVHAANCSVSATGVSFGSYDPSSTAPAQATGTVTVTCSRPILSPESGPYSIALSSGAGGSYADRTMAAGSEVLHYQLYSDPSYTTVWGDGSGGSGVVNGSYSLPLFILSASYNHSVYGRIPADQWPAAGSYTDTITVTVSY